MATDGIGTQIRKRRQVLGMTQDELAAELHVSRSTVTSWESGKHFPLRYLGAIEHVLGVSLTGVPDAGQLADPKERELWDTLTSLGLSQAQHEQLLAAYRRTRDAAGHEAM